MDLRLCMPMCKRVINSDISEDITLPDYYPEIRRVLCVRENLLPPSKFVSGNKIDIGGTVDYTLIYVSNEGRLCSAPLSAEYSFSVPLDNVSEFELSEGVNILARSVAENSTVRVSGPRRLQIRSHIRSSVSAWGKQTSCESFEGIEDPSSIQRLETEANCAEMLCESSDIVTVRDEFKLPFENATVSVADGCAVVQGSRIDGEMVYASGEVIVRMLIMCDDGRSERAVRKIPFEVESDLDGVDMDSDSLLRINGAVTDLTVSIEEGNVFTEASLVLELCMAQNKNISYVCDAYSTEQPSATDMRVYSLPVVVANKNAGLSFSERIEQNEIGFPEGAEIVDIYGSANIGEAMLEDGKYILKGSCKYNLICLKDGEYSHCEVRVPLRYECEGEEEIDGFDACAEVISCKARGDGEFLSIDAELALSYNIMGSRQVQMLERVTFYDKADKSSGQWTVCFVQPEDTAWSIAKKYGVRECDVGGDPTSDRYVIIER